MSLETQKNKFKYLKSSKHTKIRVKPYRQRKEIYIIDSLRLMIDRQRTIVVIPDGIDDISITPAAATCSFALPPSMCPGDSPFDLNDFVSPFGGGTFKWTSISGGVPTETVTATFDPALAYSAAVTTGTFNNDPCVTPIQTGLDA